MGLIRRGRRLKTTCRHDRVQPQAEALESRCLLSVTFASPTQFTGVTDVTGIAVGDLNGDGKQDVVVAGLSPSSGVPVVGVYLNKGGGTFGTPTIFPFGGTPAGIAVGDFTGSGKLDIAVVDSSTNELDVFLGDGTGNFTPGVGGSLGGTSGDTAVAVGDFSGGGEDDIAVLDPVDNEVVTAIGGANGAFSLGSSFAVPDPQAIVAADFNHDGHPDLAVASGNGQVYIALNDGSGNFTSATPYSLSSAIVPLTSLAVADFNGDGLPDLVGLGTGPTGPLAGVLLNAGSGTFSAGATLAVPADATSVTTGDFSQMGNQDIAVIGSNGSLDIIPGDGSGQFGSGTTVFSTQLGSPIGQAVTGDFNGDTVPDIAYLSATGGFAITLDSTGPLARIATLTPTVAKSTLPSEAVGGTAVHGNATVDVTNSTAATVKGKVTVVLYASSDGLIDTNSASLGSVKTTLSLKPNATSPVSFPVKLPTTLGAGTYALLAQTVDPSDNVTTAAAGPSLTVAAPFLAFSETVTTIALAGSVVSGTTSHAMAKVVITNGGNINATGTTMIDLSASTTADVIGTAISSLSRSLLIRANGGTATVLVPFKAFPNLADNSYYFTASVTDPMGGSSVASTDDTTLIAAPLISLALAFGNIPRTVLTSGAPLIITNNGNVDDATTFTAVIGFSTDSAGDDIVGTNAGTLAPARVTVRAGKTATIHVTGWNALFKSLPSTGPYFLTVTLTDANGDTASQVSAGEV